MPGRLVHFEIPANDTSRAREFYSSLFGWSFQSYDGPVEYHMTPAGGDPGGAIFRAESDQETARIYFDTDDIEGTIARVRELGGQADEKQPVPSMGWFAHCRDSEGNSFSLWQNDESAQAPGAA